MEPAASAEVLLLIALTTEKLRERLRSFDMFVTGLKQELSARLVTVEPIDVVLMRSVQQRLDQSLVWTWLGSEQDMMVVRTAYDYAIWLHGGGRLLG